VQLLDDDERRVVLARRGRDLVGGLTWDRATTELERALLDGVSGSWALEASPADQRG
jgi:hypothetical protein